MTTSGTYAFSPSVGETILAAFSMCGIRRVDITTEHLIDATFQANLLMAEFTNKNPNQWAYEVQSQVLVAGTSQYSLATRTVAIAVAYIETGSGVTTTSRVLAPLSIQEYASIPNKLTQGFPNSYVFNLYTPTPTITLYLVPDSTYTYTLKVCSFRSMQDISQTSGETIDVPYRFLDAFTAGLAARLAVNFATDRVPGLQQLAENRFVLAAAQDQERVNIYLQPALNGYFS